MDKMRRTMLILILVMVMGSATVTGRMGRYEVPRVNMIQRRSCYYEPFDKQLTCQCTDKETNTFLKLRLMFFIKEKGQEVRSVLIKSCEDLMVGLDLTGVNPMEIPIKFKNCGKISFSYINFDQQFSGGQLLELVMETVSSVRLEGLEVKDALQIKTNKVKELVLFRNRFTHIPLPGLEISQADKLVIQDNYFHRISAGSITVKSAKEVEVINNQFSLNAIQVVRSSEGSRLYISCNRLLGEVQSPECVTTSTTAVVRPTTPTPTTTSSTTTLSSTTRSTTARMTTEKTKDFKISLLDSHNVPTQNALSEELLIGLVVGVAVLVLILLVVVIILCCKRKQTRAKAVNDVKDDTEKLDILAEKEEDKDSGNDSDEVQTSPEPERESLIQSEEMHHIIEASKPKFSSPVWLDEIQNNKIFNKQKSINKEEELTPKRSSRPFPVRSISEIIDSDSESEDTQESSNTNRNNNQSKLNSDVLDTSDSGTKKEERKPHQETDL